MVANVPDVEEVWFELVRNIGQLGAFASEVTRVVLEVETQGIIGGQARIGGVQGTWADEYQRSETTSPSSTAPRPSSTSPTLTTPPQTTDDTTTLPSSPPTCPPTSDPANTNTSNTSNISNTSQTLNTSSSSETTVSTPVTTVIQTTVITTSDGQVFSIVFKTSPTTPPGSVITASAPASSTSSTNTGAIVGGVVGGVAGVAILSLLLVWWRKRWRKRTDLDRFDGNFDPDRVVAGRLVNVVGSSRHKKRPSGAPTLPNVGGVDPEMAQFEDDGMGGRLAGASVGGGVVSPYPLFTAGHSPHPSQAGLVQYTSVPPSQIGHGSDSTHSPPPSAGFVAGGHPGEWRHPSPGPSLGAQTSSLSGGGGAAAGMSVARMAKEREAFGGGGFVGGVGMPVPHHPNAPPSAYYQGYAPQGRRMSVESSGAQSGVFYSTNSDYSQGNSSGTCPTSSQQHGGGSQRLSVVNPDSEDSYPNPHPAHFDENARKPQDAGGLGDEEIPPTYESLLKARAARGEAAPVAPPEKGGLQSGNDGNEPQYENEASGVGASGSGPRAV
ncbi:hypothetical protein V5O48_006439 [Marasmius crinis-equi]|uniref:Uncharacterized protein n=1 Tax=Marasmius crinis-equi TaxID=585013 RepID=A0ABR3FK54_9AGAR